LVGWAKGRTYAREESFRPRLPRRQHWADAACYLLIERGRGRETVFADDENRHPFLGLVSRYQRRFGFWV
jgi:hypothetical protein